MNQDLGLKILGQIMKWTDDEARKEFDWLKLMARLKYDGYRDFQAGMRFVESLATWLQQFEQDDRKTAYAFVRDTLIYIGPNEIQQLVEQFYPHIVQRRLVRTVAKDRCIRPYSVLVDADARDSIERLRRQTLFMGLSDGARIDTIRHTNSGLLGNEQFVQGTQVDTEKWKDLLNNLREDLNDSDARFRIVYLVDDFTGSGTSVVRRDEETGKWKGKLCRFRDSVVNAQRTLEDDRLFEDGWQLCIHHYVASSAAVKALRTNLDQSEKTDDFPDWWAQKTTLSFGVNLPDDLPIDADAGRHHDFIKLTTALLRPGNPYEAHRYRAAYLISVSGMEVALFPLCWKHNTPNNTGRIDLGRNRRW